MWRMIRTRKGENSMVEFKQVALPKIVETYTKYENLESSSGEVFYIKDGKLLQTSSRADFEKIQEETNRKERVYFLRRNTYFSFAYKGIRYSYPLLNQEDILESLKLVEDFDLQVALLTQFANEKVLLEQQIASILNEKGGN
jgi:hypothetical protein